MVTGGALVSVITWTCQPIHLAAEKQHFLLSIPQPSPAQPLVFTEYDPNGSHYNWRLWAGLSVIRPLRPQDFLSQDIMQHSALHCGIVFYILDAIIPFNLIQLVYAAACSLQSKLQKSNALCFDLFYAPQYDIDVCNVYRTELKVK